MLRVLLTVLVHGVVFIALWVQQTQDSVSEPNNLSTGYAYWQSSMDPLAWGVLAFMLLSPVLALLSRPRQSVRGRSLLIVNWLFAPVIVIIGFMGTTNQVWLWWLIFSTVMFGIAIFHALRARVARVPKQNGKK